MSRQPLYEKLGNYHGDNGRWLRRRFPSLVGLMEGAGNWLPDTVEVSIARSGVPTLAVRFQGSRVHVHSTVNPVLEAQRWVDELSGQLSEFIVVIGMGLGYHLDRLVECKPGLRVVVIEPNRDVFVAGMVVRNQGRWMSHPRFDLVVTDDPGQAAQLVFQRYRGDLLRSPQFLVWPATSRYAPDFLPAFERKVLDLVRAARTNVATNYRFSTQWIDNFFVNARVFLSDPGVAILFNRFRGRPGIIVSAGPSLERNARLLAGAKERAVIIAAGSAINPLLKNGIEADLLVSFDPGEGNYRHFEKLRLPNVPLVYIPTIYPRIVQEYAGPRFGSGTNTFPFIGWTLEQVGEYKGTLTSGPSVANVSWDLAVQMGLNPIILVGQDLAYTDQKSHAEGAVHARTVEIHPDEVGRRYLEVESVDGGTVFTSRSMYSMKVWFEGQIPRFPQITTIDATEGGAKISGTQIMTLREAIDNYCTDVFNPSRTILELHSAERSRLQARRLDVKLDEVFDHMRVHLRACEELADVGFRAGKQLLGECKTRRLTEQRYREAVNRLHRLLKELSGSMSYRVFVEPLIPHIVESVNFSLQGLHHQQMTLHDKGSELARQYVILFGNVKRMTRHVERLVRRTSRGEQGA